MSSTYAAPLTLDIEEFDRLNESILELIRGEPEGQWVLDLSQVAYMGSASLGLLVNLRQQIKQSGGRLVLCGLSPQMLHIFKTCCMERLFRIVKRPQGRDRRRLLIAPRVEFRPRVPDTSSRR